MLGPPNNRVHAAFVRGPGGNGPSLGAPFSPVRVSLAQSKTDTGTSLQITLSKTQQSYSVNNITDVAWIETGLVDEFLL